jgi:hypothetical protein
MDAGCQCVDDSLEEHSCIAPISQSPLDFFTTSAVRPTCSAYVSVAFRLCAPLATLGTAGAFARRHPGSRHDV